MLIKVSRSGKIEGDYFKNLQTAGSTCSLAAAQVLRIGGKGELNMLKSEFWNAKIRFLEPVLGSMPTDENVLSTYIISKAPGEAFAQEEEEVYEDFAISRYTVFPRDEKGVFFWNYQVKAFLKNNGNVLKDMLGVKNLKSKIENAVFIEPRRIYLFRGREVVQAADRFLERPLRAQTARGERVTLAGSELVEAGCEMEFQIEILENKEVTEKIIRTILDYGRRRGLGQWRNGGWGQFEVVEFQKK